jgi:putative hemolysin
MPKIFGWIPKPTKDPRGSGKTGGMVAHLHQRKLEGKRILANFETAFNDDLVSADLLAASSDDKEIQDFLRHSVIGVTEIHQFLESRSTQRGKQIRTTHSILQLRKLRVDFHWDSQAEHQVDKRLKDQTDYLIVCENLGCAEMDCVEQSCGIPTCGIFHYEMFHRRTAEFIKEWWLNGPREFYHLFDSENISMDYYREEN